MAIKHKRFIAGAKCPKCQALDSVMLYAEDSIEKLECINCGYKESQDDANLTHSHQSDSIIGVFKPE